MTSVLSALRLLSQRVELKRAAKEEAHRIWLALEPGQAETSADSVAWTAYLDARSEYEWALQEWFESTRVMVTE